MNGNRFLLIGMAVFLAGCTLAPDYTRPASPVPASWPDAAYSGKTTDGASRVREIKWREFFTDEKLRRVIETALTNNRDLRLAALNVERARALYGIQKAELFPALSAVGSESKEHVPADLSSSGSAKTNERYDVKLGISSWEIDFFGRIRSLKDRALEEYLATEEACRSARIMLVSAVADAYLALAADREILKLMASSLETQEASYRLIRKRYEVGMASELDLRRAQSQVDTAKGNVARYAQTAAQDENTLNLLVGASLPEALLPAGLGDVHAAGEISPGLPSEALLQRPDVLAAEHRLKAANANIGAARAAFLPRISLTTTIGTASADLSGLFAGGSETWSFAPQMALPVFDARTWSAYDVTKVEREMSLAQYERAIQAAFKEVADVLAARGAVNRQIEAQKSLVAALAEVHRLSEARYTKGIDGYLGVLDAQRSLYAAQQALISLNLAGLVNQVTFYKVLGGGD